MATKKKATARPWQASSIGLLLVAAAGGGAVGWSIRDAKAKETVTPEADAVLPVGSAVAAGPAPACKSWSEKVCKELGSTSEGCRQAETASKLLPGAACTAAETKVAATVKKARELRSDCTTLVDRLCKEFGDKSETCTLVRERTDQFPAAQCKKMLENYPQVLKELKRLEKASAPLTAELVAKHAAGDGPAFGPADAKVTIVEYSDFQCPYCAKAAMTVKKIKERYGKVVRFVFRQYPLPNHPAAMPAAQASLAAHAQGKFWAYHDLLFENPRKLAREDLEGHAKKLSLDLTAFNKALDDKSYEQTVKDDMALGSEVGIEGTPSLFIGPARVKNPTDFDSIAKVIDEQLKAAGVEPPAAE